MIKYCIHFDFQDCLWLEGVSTTSSDNLRCYIDRLDRTAQYYNVDVNGKVVKDVAWYAYMNVSD
jgi:hypothetical protein